MDVALLIIWRKYCKLFGVSLGVQELAELSSGGRDLALSRFRLLEPHFENDRPLRVIATETGVPYRTLQRWVAQYRKFGLVALARRMPTIAGYAGQYL